MRTPLPSSFVLARRLCSVGWLACALGLEPPCAQAQSGLQLQEGVTCLQREQLESELEPGIASTLEHESLTVLVQGSSEDPRSATIRMTRGTELVAERTFSPGPPRCPDFHAAITVTIAIMLRSVETQPDPSPAPVPVPVPVPAPRPPAPPHPRERIPLALSPRVSGLMGWGVEASRQRGLSAELELASRRWAVRAGVLALFSVDERFKKVAAGYATRPLTGSADGCFMLFRARNAHAKLCAGLLLGSVQVRGLAGSDSVSLRTKSYGWAALRAQLELALRLASPLHLLTSLSVLRGLGAIELTADDSSGHTLDAISLPRSGVLLGLGFSYEFQRQGSTHQEHE